MSVSQPPPDKNGGDSARPPGPKRGVRPAVITEAERERAMRGVGAEPVISPAELETEIRAKKEARDKAILEIQGRKRQRGMDFYIPNKFQFKGHTSLAKTVLMCAGNRSGKSQFGAMELCWHLTGKYPEWYPNGRKLKQPIKAAVSATSFAMVQRVIEPKLTALLPVGTYRVRRSPQGYLQRLVHQNGGFVDILTLEMADMAYESADFDFVWEDEPQQKRKREALCRGLIDRNGLEVITFTPLIEPWMKDELIDKADGKNIAMFTASTRDNMFDMYGNPILSEESIKRFEESVSDDYKETRLHGVFFTARGIIYKSFSEHHISDGKYEYPNPVICVLDPHDRLPHHLIWASVDRQDDIFVDSEMSIHCELPDLAKAILKHEKNMGYKMRKRMIDPNFGRKPAAAGSNFSVIQELTKHGVSFYEPCDDIELGHMIVRDYLHFDKDKPVTAVNKPKLTFSRERCPITIKSMRNLQYQEWAGKTKDDKNPKEVEKEKDNHGADTVRYLCIERPKYEGYRIHQEDLSEAPY